MSILGGIAGQLGKDLLRNAFPDVYKNVTRYRSVKKKDGAKSKEHEDPLVKAVHHLNDSVKESNDVATDSLEALLVQNDILSKILKKGGIGGGNGSGSIFDLKKILTDAAEIGALGLGAGMLKRGYKAMRGAKPGAPVAKPGAVKSGPVRGKNGRFMSRAQAAAAPEEVAEIGGQAVKQGSKFLKFGGRLLRGTPLLSGAIEGYEEYSASGNAARAGTKAVGVAAGSWGGALAGAAIGTAIMPGIGTAVGGIIGGFAGSYAGSKLSGAGYDLVTGKDGHALMEAGTINYKTDDLVFKATDIIINAKNIIGIPSASASKFPTFRPGITPGNYIDKETLEDRIKHPRNSNGTPRTLKPDGTPYTAKDDIEYKGPGTGHYDSKEARANYMQPGDKFGAPGQNLVEITTAGGHKFKVNAVSAEPFKRTIEDLEKAGAPLGNIGAYSPRPGGIAGTGKMSQHAMGNAMDLFSQSGRDVISPAGRRWIESHPNEWRKILDDNGMLSGGDWKNPDLGHIEWAGRKPWLEDEKGNTTSQTNPVPEPVKPPPGPTSYKVDMPGLIKKIKETQFGASVASDNYIRGRIKEGVPAGVKLTDDNTISGKPEDLEKIKSGFKERGIDTSAYIQPIPTESVKTVPVPVRTTDPSVERLKLERDKAKKDLQRIKKKQKTEVDNQPKDSDGENAPQPKDNTRSDRALFNINPQLHQEGHPQ